MHRALRPWPLTILPLAFSLGCHAPDGAVPAASTDACTAFALVEPADGAEPPSLGEKHEHPSYSEATLALMASRAVTETRRAESKARSAGAPTGAGARELGDVLAAMHAQASGLEAFLEVQRTEGHAVHESDERFGATWTALLAYCKGRKNVRECREIPAMDAPSAREKLLALARNAGEFKNAVLKDQLGRLKELDAATRSLADRYKASMEAVDERMTAARKREEAGRKSLRTQCGASMRPRSGPVEVVAAKAGSNPREQVVVVETRPAPGLAKVFERIAAASQGEGGHARTSGTVGAGFGSGFVVVRAEGGKERAYVVTNRHVAEAGEVEIRSERGKRFPHAEVVYEDPFADLAVIGFTRQPDAPVGLAIADRPARDGDPVVVLGFPGLGDTPAYQMTRGNVSNERLRVDGLRLLQHTAPTDPGSSGGPLLDASGRVVGVASGKARAREAVSVAVPRADLIEALERAADTERRRDDEAFRRASLLDSCLLAVSSAQEGWEPPDMLFSQALVEEQGVESFAALLEAMPDDREQLAHVWQAGPIHALEVALGMRLVKKLKQQIGLKGGEACQSARGVKALGNERFVDVPIDGSEGSAKLRFVFERGRYKLRDF